MVKQGDIIKISFDPQHGHEQAGYIPALVISNDEFNARTNLAIVCPITNTNKKHPFHVELDERTQTTGVILCDQVKTLDLKARNAQRKEKCPEDIWMEARDIIISFL